MDQSPAIQALVAGYGGSDPARPSAQRQHYTRFFSIHEPRDLGEIPGGTMMLDGVVGAQEGTQTLFFRFHAPEPARIGLRQVPLNPYTDQYISLGLSGPDGKAIPVQSGAPPAQQTVTTRLISEGQSVRLEGGYIADDYWDEGYAEAEGVFLFTPPIFSIEFGSASEIDSLIASAGGECPPGAYIITVASSQWPPLPFRVQILARSSAKLPALATLSLEGSGRVGLFDLEGTPDFALDAAGRLTRTYHPGAAPSPLISDFSITTSAKVQRLSPLQGLFF
jgi:hypothetical protein